jgi:hypothetical protein
LAEGGLAKRAPTAEELKLIRRIQWADWVAVISGGILFFAGVAAVYGLIVSATIPEGVYLGMRIMFAAMIGAPVIVVLLVVLVASIVNSRAAGKELEQFRARLPRSQR